MPRPHLPRSLVASVCLAALLLAAPLSAQAAAPTRTLTVDGLSDLTPGKTAEARELAIRSAQRVAIESTVGVRLKSILSQAAFSNLKDDKEVFQQKVTSKLEAQSEGFLRGFKLVKEGPDGKVYRVTLDVEVDDVALARELSIQARALANARFPKLMFIVSEEYTNKDGKAEKVTESTLQAVLEDALLAGGFDLVNRGQMEKIRAGEKLAMGEALDDNVAAKLAMEYGAEYIVNAVARIKYTSFNDLGQQEHHGYVEIALKGINASSAAVVASFKQGGNSPPNAYSEADLKVKAVRHVAPPVVDNLVQRIIESWDREQQNGVRYSVKVLGVKSYKVQGLAVIDLLEKLPGVKQVKEISSGGERLEVEVFFPSEQDVSALKRAVLKGSTAVKELKTLDVTYSRGRELNLKL